MKKNSIAVLFLPLSLCLSGCGGYSVRSQKFLDGIAPAQKLSDLRRHKLEQDKKYAYQISRESEAFDFETGKSPAVLFELPDFKASSTVEIKSYCDCFGFTKSVFIPIGVILDKDFNKINEMKFATHPPTFAQPAHFVAEAQLGEEDKYVLIYSDPKRYGKPADAVSVDVLHVRKEKMDYIRKGLVQETYSTTQAGVWWRGDTVGAIRAWVKTR